MQIAGKTILITGASEGIGAACAAEFRSRGAKLALIARNAEKLKQVAGSDALAVAGDLTVEADRKRCVEMTLSRFGQIDVLLNNAGAGIYAPSWNAPMDEVRRMMELNYFAVLGMIQLVVPQMRQRKAGMVVNVGSIAGKVTLPWLTLYSASKYALGSLTDGMRMELKRDGVHAMTVCPGYVATHFQDHVLTGKPPKTVKDTKIFKITPEQCARAIANGVERNARVVVTPRSGWGFIVLERLFPSLVDAQLESMYHRGLES